MNSGRSIEQQKTQEAVPLPVRAWPERATPVFGVAEPAQGIAGRIRLMAYGRPEHDPMHWLLLLAADRLATMEELLGEAGSPTGWGLISRHFYRQAQANPIAALLVGAGIALTTYWLLRARR
jgi:hypothetical protein